MDYNCGLNIGNVNSNSLSTHGRTLSLPNLSGLRGWVENNRSCQLNKFSKYSIQLVGFLHFRRLETCLLPLPPTTDFD